MNQVSCTIKGITPLLCNKFYDAAQMAATSGNRQASVGDRGTPREQAEKKLYLTNDKIQKPCIPAPNLFRAIIDAGTFFKSGKGKITTQKSSIIPACVSIDELVLEIKHKDPWTVDSRPVRIPSTGGRIIAHRPCFEDWELSFSLQCDPEMLSVKMLRELIDAAGSRIGLGDFRPACKGPFGRFKVVSWKEKE